MADNEIRLNVTAVENEPLNVCVEQVPMNPVNVENTYKGLDYNLLKNKPSIDGVPLEGDKTTAEVIGFDKEYVDDAILATNAKIDEVSSREGYSKEEIDNKVIVIEADIDAQADAIQKTRSDFMESDSELQQQINAHANELTTQKNDIDDLGDQVAGIESKIPEATSDTNPLINKQQLLDEEMDLREDMMESDSELQTQINALADAIQGIGPAEGTYTKENLIGGKGVEIVKETASEGIDENTLACWHFDTDNKDVVNNLNYGSYLQSNTEYKKFGQASNRTTYAYESNLLSDTSSDWTIEGFFHRTSAGATAWVILGKGTYFTGSDVDGACFMLKTSGNVATLKNAEDDAVISTSIDTNSFEDWEHVAFQRKGGLLQGFHKGKKILEKAVSADGTPGTFRTGVHSGYSVLIDEARISNVARYDGDFEPPTKPFSDATYETGRSLINNTAGKNIGEVFYSQSNSASDNAGALPLFTGETIVNADALYPEFFSWVSSHSELQTTAEEYEAELLSRGDCNKYVVDGTSVRLPKKTLDKRYLIESKYPTETDSSWYNLYSDGWIEQGGRVSSATENADFVVTLTKPMLNNRYCIQRTSASASTTTASFRSVSVKGITTTEFKMYITDTISPTYWYVCGQSSITPQDKIDYPWVQAYNYAVPASSAQAAEFQGALSGKADTDLGNIPANYDYVYSTFNQEAGTTAAASWWRVYRSGWIEQGGTTGNVADTETITFAKPFARVPFIYCLHISSDSYVKGVNITSISATSFTFKKTTEGGTLRANRINWFACGQGV